MGTRSRKSAITDSADRPKRRRRRKAGRRASTLDIIDRHLTRRVSMTIHGESQQVLLLEAIVLHLTKTLTELFVSKSGPHNRIGNIFIDYLRNGRGATLACTWFAGA